LDTKQDAENVRLATSAPHHGALFRDLSAPLVAPSAEGRFADLQKQNAALKKELEKANAAPQVEVQILTAQLAETNAQRDAQAATQQLQTRALESELHKLKAKLAAPAPALSLPSSLTSYAVTRVDVRETSTTNVALRTAILEYSLGTGHVHFRDDRTPTPFQIAPSIREPLHPTSYAVTRVDVRETSTSSVDLRTVQFKTAETNVKCVELLSSVVIGGATGTNAAKVNGIYEPTIELYNGKLLFQKHGMKDHWLHFDASTGFWIVSSTAGKDAKNTLGGGP
jgi:hypothetical protein